MSRLRFRISMSLDGFVAGPQQIVEHLLGIGSERLHEWVTRLAEWRAPHRFEGGEVNESSAVLRELNANIGVARLVDEMDTNLVPTHLGRGVRLFDSAGDDL